MIIRTVFAGALAFLLLAGSLFLTGCTGDVAKDFESLFNQQVSAPAQSSTPAITAITDADRVKIACNVAGEKGFGLPIAIDKAALEEARKKAGDAVTRRLIEPSVAASNAFNCTCLSPEEIKARGLSCSKG